jgi:formate-dependent nitrite reductase membrane component NrfD
MKMNNDKAIIKALQSTESPRLSADFNSRLMAEVYRTVERKKKRAYILSLCLVSGVSLALIGMAVYVFYTYSSFDLSIQLPNFSKMQFSSESKSIFGFSIYIALLSLILIGLDHYLRHKWMMRKNR